MDKTDCSRFLGEGECCYYCHEEGNILPYWNHTICRCLLLDIMRKSGGDISDFPIHSDRQAHVFPDQPEFDP